MEKTAQAKWSDRDEQSTTARWHKGRAGVIGAIVLLVSASATMAVPISQSPGSPDAPPVTAVDPGFGVDLKLGDRGEAVAQMQASLLYVGYNTGDIDGVFDAMVQAQVLRFQGSNALPTTGIMDAETQRVLLAPSRLDVQRRLQILAYYRGPLDGQANAEYEEAKAAFIAANGIEPIDGSTLDAEFERVLFSPDAIAYQP